MLTERNMASDIVALFGHKQFLVGGGAGNLAGANSKQHSLQL